MRRIHPSRLPCVRGTESDSLPLGEKQVDALARLETWLQTLAEGPARWLTGQRLQPVEIARQLYVAMDDGILVTGDRPIAPNRYVVTLGEADHAPLAGIAVSLQREFERFVEAEAAGRGYRLAGLPRVELRLDTAHPSGRATVVATLDAPPTDEPTPTRTLHTVPRARRTASIVLRALGNSWRVAPGDRLVVGRDPSSDIFLDHESVSRIHALVTFALIRGKTPALEVEDRGSTNRTWVEEKEVDSAVIAPGGSLRFGSVEVSVTGGRQDGSST